MPNTVPIAFSFLALWLGLAPIDVVGGDAFAEFLQPAFVQSCVKCHGKGPKVKGKVNLLELKSADDLAKKPELLGKLIEALDSDEESAGEALRKLGAAGVPFPDDFSNYL